MPLWFSATPWWPSTTTSTLSDVFLLTDNQTATTITSITTERLIQVRHFQRGAEAYDANFMRRVFEHTEGTPIIASSAERRAEDLLMELLNPEQRESYRKGRNFEVIGASGKLYRLNRGWAGNVEVLKPDRVASHRLCCHPEQEIPRSDNLITQMFMLREAESEAEFLARANRRAA